MLRRRRQAKKEAQQQQQEAQQQQAAQPVSQEPAPPPPQAATPAQSTGLTDDDLTQLKQLGQLHESGVLTDAEFEAEKQKILGKT
jgi:predicted flap endonuclease-1-like 5' DNA nuclease